MSPDGYLGLRPRERPIAEPPLSENSLKACLVSLRRNNQGKLINCAPIGAGKSSYNTRNNRGSRTRGPTTPNGNHLENISGKALVRVRVATPDPIIQEGVVSTYSTSPLSRRLMKFYNRISILLRERSRKFQPSISAGVSCVVASDNETKVDGESADRV